MAQNVIRRFFATLLSISMLSPSIAFARPRRTGKSVPNPRSYVVADNEGSRKPGPSPGQQPAAQPIEYSDPLVSRPAATVGLKGHQASNKGIHVGQPKVFDDRSLQLMLAAAEQRLATIQAIDQARTTANIGAIQGGSQTETGLAVQIASVPTPSVVSSVGSNGNATNGSTQSVSTGTTGSNGLTVVSGNNPTTTGVTNTSATTSNGISSNSSNSTGTNASTQTTTPTVNPMLVPAPAQSGLSLPTNVSVSASDVLSEEMQLTFEIANLRLLLQGSLNDRFITGNQKIKQHATIGFPISIEAPEDREYKNAVAEITVTVTTWPDFYDKNQNRRFYEQAASVYATGLLNGTGRVCRAYAEANAKQDNGLYSDRACPDPPGLMAILPREKTYNVVDIRATNVSVAGSATAKVLTAGVTWYHATKHFYVVQAQDTVAFEDEPKLTIDRARLNEVSSTFGWQFRPVLNENRVRSGLRQLFAELSFPTLPPPDGKFYGTVTVEARWRRYDQKRGGEGDPIVDRKYERKEVTRIQTNPSLWKAGNAKTPSIEWIGAWQLPNFDLRPKSPESITWDDAGNGFLSVAANGFYTPGTAVVIGSNIYSPVTGNYFYDPDKIRFVVPAADVVRAGSVFLEEQGGKQRLLDRDLATVGPFEKISIIESIAVPFNSTDMLVSVCYTGGLPIVDDQMRPIVMNRPIALLGGKAYGLSDQPYSVVPQSPCKDPGNLVLTLRAPADTVRAAKQIKIKELFFGPTASDEHSIEIVNDFSAAKAVTVASANKCTLFAIQGSQLFFDPLDVASANQPVHVRISNEEIGALNPQRKDRCSFVPLPEQKATRSASTPHPDATPTKNAQGQSATDLGTAESKDKTQGKEKEKEKEKETVKAKPRAIQSPPKEPKCEPKRAYVDTALGLATLLVAAPDCLLKGVKQIEVYRGDESVLRSRVQTVLLPVTEEKSPATQIDTLEVQAGTTTVHLKGSHLELVDLRSLYFTGFVGVSLNPKFPVDASYIEIVLPTGLANTTGNYALNFIQQDKDKSPGGALVRITKPKTQ